MSAGPDAGAAAGAGEPLLGPRASSAPPTLTSSYICIRI